MTYAVEDHEGRLGEGGVEICFAGRDVSVKDCRRRNGQERNRQLRCRRGEAVDGLRE